MSLGSQLKANLYQDFLFEVAGVSTDYLWPKEDSRCQGVGSQSRSQPGYHRTLDPRGLSRNVVNWW